MAYAALMAAKDKFNADVAYTESVTQNDQVRVARQYADRATRSSLVTALSLATLWLKLPKYPDQYFINYGGAVQNGTNLVPCSMPTVKPRSRGRPRRHEQRHHQCRRRYGYGKPHRHAVK
jgi:hypothetical protein